MTSGKYARPERERRWLLREVPSSASEPRRIVDRYIRGTRLRLRAVDGEVFKLGQKVRPDPADPSVVLMTNIYLTRAEYEVFAALPADVLSKTRWKVGRLSVDAFSGAMDGLVLAEVELGEGEAIDAPPTAVADVTHDDRFSGGTLAATSRDELLALLSGFGVEVR